VYNIQEEMPRNVRLRMRRKVVVIFFIGTEM
jgi:hypothetical protein